MEVEERVEDQVEDQAVGQVEDQEIWKDIEGYEGIFQVSTHGRVKSLARTYQHFYRGVPRPCTIEEKILTSHANKQGYFRITLVSQTKRKYFSISRLVALSFLDPVDGKPEVDHIDRNKSNNHISNLRWADDYDQSRNRDFALKTQGIIFDSRSNRRKPWSVTHKNITKCFETKDEAQEYRKALLANGLDPSLIEKRKLRKERIAKGINISFEKIKHVKPWRVRKSGNGKNLGYFETREEADQFASTFIA